MQLLFLLVVARVLRLDALAVLAEVLLVLLLEPIDGKAVGEVALLQTWIPNEKRLLAGNGTCWQRKLPVRARERPIRVLCDP